jgi:hypothetical protein
MGILINFSFTGCETTMQEVTVWTKTFGIVWVSSPRKPDRETLRTSPWPLQLAAGSDSLSGLLTCWWIGHGFPLDLWWNATS